MLMKVYGKDGVVIATHDATNAPDPSVYGPNVQVVTVPKGTVLARSTAFPAPGPGELDARPFMMPTGQELSGADLSTAIKAEASQRILDKVDEPTQRNITAFAASLLRKHAIGGELTEADKADLAAADAIYGWVAGGGGMLAKARALAEAGDTLYRLDSKWPAWNASWDAFVARF